MMPVGGCAFGLSTLLLSNKSTPFSCRLRCLYSEKSVAGIRVGRYKKNMEATARTLKALGDETRLRILALLNEGELCVCDIMAALSLPQSTASRHLAYLRNAGWVRGTRRGKWMYYRLITELTFTDPGLGAQILHYLCTLEQSKKDQEALQDYLLTKDKETCAAGG
jgi:ArsR family transcriptional regulator